MNTRSEITIANIAPGRELPSSPYRYDVQGLRAVAVALVVLYHFEVPYFSGGFIGVDVFFVISGFVITRALLSELQHTGRIALLPFWARRARRLMPASVVTLVLSVAIGALLLPRLYLESLLRDAVAVALYVPNVLFAQDELDYLADASPSILQHYWSLGVEEQFYIIWPLLLGIAFVLTGSSRKRAFVILCVITAVSLAASIALTYRVQPWAFFSMPTRVWEFGAGGLVAFYAPSLVKKASLAKVGISWVALIALIGSAVLLTESLAFPGFAAILPVVATAVLILLSDSRSRFSPARILSTRVMLFVGAISYSLYLVHWPIIVLAEQRGGTNRTINGLETAALIALAVALAWLLYTFVERRFIVRRGEDSRPKRTIFVSICAAVVLAFAAFSLQSSVAASEIDSGRVAAAAAAESRPIFAEYVPSDLHPSLRDATLDVPSIYADGCHLDFLAADARPCYFGDSGADASVALFGDSHAAQWFPALKRLADSGEIYLRVDTKSSCPSADIEQLRNGVPYAECDVWRDDVVAEMQASPPDVVLLSNYGDYYATGSADPANWADGIARTIDALGGSSELVVVADTPHFTFQPPLCLSAHVNDAQACSAQREVAINSAVAEVEADIASRSNIDYLDFTSQLCSEAECGAIIGSTLVYRDAHHLTATKAETFSGALMAAISASAGD
jgi:peptidoglycan/LPS O-acetylase OafA/YrhL